MNSNKQLSRVEFKLLYSVQNQKIYYFKKIQRFFFGFDRYSKLWAKVITITIKSYKRYKRQQKVVKKIQIRNKFKEWMLSNTQNEQRLESTAPDK